jgi:hypothetical protein
LPCPEEVAWIGGCQEPLAEDVYYVLGNMSTWGVGGICLLQALLLASTAGLLCVVRRPTVHVATFSQSRSKLASVKIAHAVLNFCTLSVGIFLCGAGWDYYFASGYAAPTPVQVVVGETIGLLLGVVGPCLILNAALSAAKNRGYFSHFSRRFALAQFAFSAILFLFISMGSILAFYFGRNAKYYPYFDKTLRNRWMDMSRTDRGLTPTPIPILTLTSPPDHDP